MTHPVRAYAFATLAPVALLAAGALLGGWWALAGFLYMTLFTYGMDRLIATREPAADPTRELPTADALSVVLALTHFVLLALVIRALAIGGLSPAAWIALYLGAALFFGQVSNSNAHELIHRRKRGLFELGKWVYISLLFGHHTSAHNKVHHRFAASPLDPNSARRNESFYRFYLRAWRGSFVKGYEAEKADLARRGTGGMNPYVIYVAGALAMLATSALAFGWRGLVVHVALAAYAQAQLLLSDYVQHYGLSRATGDNGKLEAVGPQHSWNSGQWFSRHLMLNAPRHSDHHAHPARPYPALVDAAAAPILPASLPAMATLALVPKLWRRVMNPALADWKARHP